MLPVAILAGGLATRLGELTQKLPKALLEVAGLPFTDHQLRLLCTHGAEDVVICAGHLGELIEDHVGDGSRYGLRVRFSFDGPTLLGTGGALRQALPLLGERFMVIYGDSYLPIDYAHVATSFLNSRQPALMTVFRNEGRYDASNVIYRDGRIVLYDKKNKDSRMEYIDYGLGCLEAQILSDWPHDGFDLAELYTDLSRRGRLAGYEATERFYEIGSVSGLTELDEFLRAQAAVYTG